MFIKQLYTDCLSEAAYYVESEGQAAIIDPLRDVEVYLSLAAERGATIKYIFETHFHADFISGHLDLSRASGAPIVYGPGTETSFPIHLANDEEVFTFGKVQMKVLHTPGHTLESACYLLIDEDGKDNAIFTGDTLFIGDVGRPDLSSGDHSKEELASMLYDSLATRIKTLADDVIVYPAHGAGSSCGKNLGPETSSTIGEQKASNYALKAQSREEFIAAVTRDLEEPPQYFPVNAKINKEGYENLDDVLMKSLQPFSVQELKSFIEEDFIVLDTRKETEFTKGFIPGSINIGLNGRFSEWAGSLLSFTLPMVLVTEPGKEKESLIRLARVGFTHVHGFLAGGYESWENSDEPNDIIIDIDADELALDIRFDDNLLVLDVRREAEFADGHIKGAMNIPLSELNDPGSMAVLDDQQNIYVHCGGGYRSVIACSLLRRQGFLSLRNVTGGWDKIREEKDIVIEKEASMLN